MPDHILKTLSESITTIESWPANLLLCVVLVMLQLMLRTGAEQFRQYSKANRNWLGIWLEFGSSIILLSIPIAIVAIGVFCYREIGDQKSPAMVLTLRGFATGFVSWVVGQSVYTLFKKYLPKANGYNDTQFYKKDNKD